MNDQAELFDVSRTVPTACPVPGCGAIRLPDQHKVVTCATDLERASAGWTGARPKACLNTHNPDAADIPY